METPNELKSELYDPSILDLRVGEHKGRYMQGIGPKASQGDSSPGAEKGRFNHVKDLAQKEILLRLVTKGIPLVDVAREIKRSPQVLLRWMKEPGFMDRLRELNAIVYAEFDEKLKRDSTSAVERIQQASDEALDKVLELMHGADSEVVQMRCAQDLLDRNPETTKTHKVQSTKRVVHIDADLVNAVLGAEKEAGITING